MRRCRARNGNIVAYKKQIPANLPQLARERFGEGGQSWSNSEDVVE